MTEPLRDKIIAALHAAAGQYHRLVLLVGEAGSGKSALLREIAACYGTNLVNINLTLACELLEVSAPRRPLRLPGILDQILDRALAQSQVMLLARPPASSPQADSPDRPPRLPQPTPLVLDNLELLFDRGLMQDPLRLLQGLSRNRTLLASWNGTFSVGRLGYAVPGHPEYRAYEAADALILTMDGLSNLDFTQ